ncbi:MAG: polysaccharide pyruvyl transferase family protein [Clostridia bacterium]|nr:polysaccharide pyruvyl transferase family protein [Clostridia bacterium]
MKKVLLYNPAIGTTDTGDEIVYESCVKVIKEIFPDSFRIQYSSHTPVPFLYHLRTVKHCDFKFACGTNMLDSYMLKPFRQWDVTLFNAWHVGPAILIGMGWRQYMGDPDLYTRLLYRKLLSKEYIHSVRDSYTEHKLKKIGITNVINTSCPTMWDLTESHCSKIPVKKADNVITTLTDYKKKPAEDRKLIIYLLQNYKRVFFWVQGAGDFEYLKFELNFHNGIDIINPGLDNFDAVLNSDMQLDYIGTRLHGGIRALQKGRRTLIIGLDNRAKEKQRDFNLNVLEREKVDLLPEVIHRDIVTKIITPVNNIQIWKNQFLK